jgi:predicted XRE-type DNA-binding protein
MARRGWQVCACMVFVATVVSVTMLAQACGGGSAGVDATPTATTLSTSTAGSGTPVPRPSVRPGGGGAPGMPDMTPGAGPPDITPGAGLPGQGPFIGGASEEFAAFLSISLEQLKSELGAEGATPASVAEAHGRTREELKTFFMEQLQAQISDAVAAGTMSQADADTMLERQASRIDDIIDGKMPSGGPGSPPIGPTPEGR